jgi:hypothetical protein
MKREQAKFLMIVTIAVDMSTLSTIGPNAQVRSASLFLS